MRRARAFSGQNVDIRSYALHHQDSERSLKLYFSAEASSFHVRFVGYEPSEVEEELDERLAELDLTSTLTVLGALEAAFRIDYLLRCDLNKRDPVSRVFQNIYRDKKDRARLDEDIFDVWKVNSYGATSIIGALKGAFKFRNWLAHGRYLVRDGQKYDYATVYGLADAALNSFPLLGP
jgi:hypothetical protein